MTLGLGTRLTTADAAGLAQTPSPWYQLYGKTSTKCLDNWSTKTPGATVRQYNCYKGTPQMWRTIGTYGSAGLIQGWDVIQNEFSGLCLSVTGDHTSTNGESVDQVTCNVNDYAQNWYVSQDYSNPGYAWFSEVCVVASCGYGDPNYYELTESTKTNGATATIIYNSGQEWQGLKFAS
jgi:hypothetical protein